MYQNAPLSVSQALPPDNNLFRFYIVVGSLLLLMTFTKQCKLDWFEPAGYVSVTAQSTPKKIKIVTHKTVAGVKDTVSITSKNRFTPNRIDIFKSDTVRRKRLETDTIVSGIVLKNSSISIQTVTPDGIQLTKRFETPPLQFSKIEIDAEGNLAIGVDSAAIRKKERRMRWRRLKNGAAITAVAVVAYMVGRSMQGSGD